MSWSEPAGRRALLALAAGCAGLAGCGFRPLHGGSEGAAVDGELAAIEVSASQDRIGQVLKNFLIDDLNPRGSSEIGRYQLMVRTQRARNALIVQIDSTTTRYDMILAAFFELRDKADKTVLYRSAARRVASFNLRRAPFATQVSQQDAEDRAARELSTYIRTELALYFAGKPPA
ncbi:MAG TPA: LPS assembly lipoprotein LptE [Geminicoccaceae bacterium]|nr:LPS assembly lipoprotein LptE [Geminicoccus sp.]HMU50668.1 LPS assembly lipoprotein LptE [Geminicoccaceae bacterium]